MNAPHSLQSTRVPPQNIEAEMSIIGTCMLYPDAVTTVVAELAPQDFYKTHHRSIFEAIYSLWHKRVNVDLVTVSSFLKDISKLEEVGGFAYLSSLCAVVPIRSRIKDFCQIVKEKAKARQLIKVAEEIAGSCYDGAPVNDLVNEFGQEIVNLSTDDTEYTRDISVITDSLLKHITEIHNGEKDTFGLPTGFADFDSLIGGLQKAEVTIIAGRPAMGKTTFVMNIAHHVAKAGTGVLIFSMEMASERLVQKLISTISGVNTKKMDRGLMTPDQLKAVQEAAIFLKKLPITIDESSALGITQIQARAKIQAMRRSIGLVVVDYMQLGKAKAVSREQEITAISAGLKALSKDLNVPVIALSQLSRKCDERPDKKPMMSDLRESGSIEQDAGVIAFIYRDEVYNTSEDNPLRGLAEIIVRKNRYGDPGTVKMFFDGGRCRFGDMVQEIN